MQFQRPISGDYNFNLSANDQTYENSPSHFEYMIPDGLQEGDCVEVRGVTRGKNIKFNLSNQDSQNVPYCLKLNQGGGWETSSEWRSKVNQMSGVTRKGIEPGQPFMVQIVAQKNNFLTKLNREKLSEFPYTCKLDEITNLSMVGDADFHSVEFKDILDVDGDNINNNNNLNSESIISPNLQTRQQAGKVSVDPNYSLQSPSVGYTGTSPSFGVNASQPNVGINNNLGATYETPSYNFNANPNVSGNIDPNYRSSGINLAAPNITMPSFGGKSNVNSPDANVNLNPNLSGTYNAPNANLNLNPNLNSNVSGSYNPPNANLNLNPNLNSNVSGNYNAPNANLNLNPKLNSNVSGSYNAPNANLNYNGPNYDNNIQLQNSNIDITQPHIEMPKINMPKFGAKGNANPNANANLNLNQPNFDADYDVYATGPNVNAKKPGFTMPSLNFPKIGGKANAPNANLNLNANQPNMNLNANTPNFQANGPNYQLNGPNMNMNSPNGELSLPTINTQGNLNPPTANYNLNANKSASLNANRPNFNMSPDRFNLFNFQKTAVDLGNSSLRTPNVNYNSNVNANGPSATVNKPTFKMPKFGGKAKATGPNANANFNPNLNANLNSPDYNMNVQNPNMNINTNTPNFSLPKFGGNASGPNANLNLNTPNISGNFDPNYNVNGPDLQMKQSNLNLQAPRLGGSGNLDGPNFNLNGPNLGGNMNLNQPNVNLDNDMHVRGPNMNFQKPEIEMNTPHMPTFSMPKIGGKGNVNTPNANLNLSGPNMNVNQPNVNINTSNNLNASGPNMHVNKPNFSMPSLHMPKFGGKGNANANLNGPNLQMNGPNYNMNGPNASVGLPTFDANGNLISPNANYNLNANRSATLNATGPRINNKSKFRGFRFQKTAVDFGNNNLRLPKGKGVGTIPNANYNYNDNRSATLNVNQPNVNYNTNLNAQRPRYNFVKPSLDVQRPAFRMPKFNGMGRGNMNLNGPDYNMNVQNPNININKPEFSLPKFGGNTDVNAPNANFNLNQGGNFNINRPDVNLNQEYNVNAPNIQMKQSNLNLQAPRVSGNYDGPSYNLNTPNLNYNQQNVNINTPQFNLPKLGGTGSYNGPSLNANAPKFNFTKPDVNMIAPRFTLPKFNGKGRMDVPSTNLNYDPNYSANLNLNRPTVNYNTNVNTNNTSFNLNKPDFDFQTPSINMPKYNAKGNVNTSNVEYDLNSRTSGNWELNKPQIETTTYNARKPNIEYQTQNNFNLPSFSGTNIDSQNFNLTAPKHDVYANYEVTKPAFNLNTNTSSSGFKLNSSSDYPQTSSNVNYGGNLHYDTPSFNLNSNQNIYSTDEPMIYTNKTSTLNSSPPSNRGITFKERLPNSLNNGNAVEMFIDKNSTSRPTNFSASLYDENNISNMVELGVDYRDKKMKLIQPTNETEVSFDPRNVSSFAIKESDDCLRVFADNEPVLEADVSNRLNTKKINHLHVNGDVPINRVEYPNKTFPYVQRFPSKFNNGELVSLEGKIPRNSNNGMSVKLQQDVGYGHDSNVDLIAKVAPTAPGRDDLTLSVYNSTQSQPIQKPLHNIGRNDPFLLNIGRNGDGSQYNVTVEDPTKRNSTTTTLTSPHNYKLDRITHIIVDGDAEVSNVKFPNQMKLPYSQKIPGTLAGARSVKAYVDLTNNPDPNFELSLISGNNPYNNKRPFVCNVGLEKNCAIIGCKDEDGEWVSSHEFAYKQSLDKVRSITIAAENHQYLIFINNQSFYRYETTDGPKTVTNLYIEGNINLKDVEFSAETPEFSRNNIYNSEFCTLL